VTVHGASMGLVTYTGWARQGQTGCKATEWESETSVRCLVGHAGRGTRRVIVSAESQVGTSSFVFSSDRGIVSVSERRNGASTGSVSVAIVGSGYGFIANTIVFRMAATGCEATEWESDSRVCCRLNQGVLAADMCLPLTCHYNQY